MQAPPAFVCTVFLCLTACAAAESAEPETRLLYLKHALASEVASSLRPTLPAGTSIELLDLAGLNGILIRGSPSECDALAAEIRRLDRSEGD